MPKKKSKKVHETSLSAVMVIAVVNCLAGGLLGFTFMASFPALEFSSPDQYERYLEGEEQAVAGKPGSRYYFIAEPTRSRSWEQKRNQLLQGSGVELTVSSAEISSWLTSRFTPGSVDDVQGSITIAPGTPNFYAKDADEVYLSIPITIRAFGKRYDRTFHAQAIISDGAAPRLILKEAFIDCAPIPHSALFLPMYERLHDAYRFTDEYKALVEAWQKVESLEVTDGSLTLSLR